MGVKYKIVKFNINEFGIDIASLRKTFSFELLAWDNNDTKLSQLRFLMRKYPQDKQRILSEAQYYLDDISVPEYIEKCITGLSEKEKKVFYSYRPFRKRGISRFITEWVNHQWEINVIELPALSSFTQDADHSTDLRKLVRRFPPMDSATSHSPELKQLIKRLVGVVCECEPHIKVRRIGVTCHQVSLIISQLERFVSNSPEGLHQDGSDYIVSALVIDKYNIDGGASKLYCTEKKEFIKSHILECGEGLLHVDKNSTIWHKVTPIKIKEPSLGDGYRNILGFDFNYI
ncbi:2OG-Fe dioxygenase family protein [Yersinia aldovae]|uniref:2OG-Fe dioxygenase family protein n=1 Tax=Yersinia aldovae TaxID=29483 RepID=UPI0011A649AB|nr:2OG-Fe dioxygenase family protein [Yersinia aldovae]